MTLLDWLSHAERALSEAGVEAPRLESQMLAAYGLRKERVWVLANQDGPLSAEEIPELEAALTRRADREPLAYILGYREFYGRRFTVDKRVLIPRQETEILVEAALEEIDRFSQSVLQVRVLDVGVGSGCIIITLKLERPSIRAMGNDISEEALEVARRNAEDLGADVRLVHVGEAAQQVGRFQLVVSNPPYIAERESLMPEVALHEPPVALYGGTHGYEAYERLATQLEGQIVPNGTLLCEIGKGQEERVRAIFAANGWRFVETKPDLSGIPRVMRFEAGPHS